MSEIDLDGFTKMLGDAIRNRAYRQRRKIAMKLEINEGQLRELESMFKVDPRNREQKLFNDMICDILDVLEMDYEIDLNTGLKIIEHE